jgi:ASC-1-like (ASCH) protein
MILFLHKNKYRHNKKMIILLYCMINKILYKYIMSYYNKYIKYKSKYLKNKNKRPSYKNNISSNMEAKYIKTLKEPWFSLIKLELKSIEGRLNRGDFNKMQVGDIVRWTNDDYGQRSVDTRITKKVEYPTFAEYLETDGLDKCLPSFTTIESGVAVYRKWYSEEDEQKYGVIAIHLELL